MAKKNEYEKQDNLQVLKSAIRSGAPARFYIFHGEEVFLLHHYFEQLKKLLLDELTESFNFHKLNPETFDIQSFADSVEAMPMMAEHTLVQVDELDIFKLAEGFGGGMGGMQGVCGAVTGAFMAISMIGSAGDKADAGKTKVETYKNVRGLAAEFKQLRGSIDCRDLKVDRVACVKCVETGAELVEKFLEK